MDVSRMFEKVVEKVKDKPVASIVASNVVTALVCGVLYAKSSGLSLSGMAQLGALALVKAVPGGKAIIEGEKKKLRDNLEKEILGETAHEEVFSELPQEGKSASELEETLDRLAAFDGKKWRNGRVSGAVYHGGDELSTIICSAYNKFVLANTLHADVFPMARKLEAEVIAMVLDMFEAGPKAGGCVTSGGTESILMAMKTYRDMAATQRSVFTPEIVAPRTAHAAFDKAAHYFRIKLIKIDVDPDTCMVNPADVEAAITSNTICIVGSAPQYAHGTIDPITELGAIATKHKIPMHVDCCLGSFVIAFAKAAGYPTKPFNFAVEGVTSISCDTHKYGFTPKGTSVIMYSDTSIRQHQYFVATDWPGGIYGSPAIAGSRPGALAVSAWATMMHFGKEGYTKTAKKILAGARKIHAAVQAHPQLKVFGSSDLSVVAFGSSDPKINTYGVSDAMKERGWNLNLLQFPTAVHICVTYANSDQVDVFISDLNDSVKEVEANPDKYAKGSAAMYGFATSLADRSMVADLATAFLDTCYQTRPSQE